jgi:hypothetical protein
MVKEDDKAIEIYTGMDFDKDDVVSIAVAEAEKRIRTKINEIGDDSTRVQEQSTALSKQYLEIGKKIIEKKIAPKLILIKRGLSTMKLSDVDFDIEVNLNVYFVDWCAYCDSKERERNFKIANTCKIILVKYDDKLNNRPAGHMDLVGISASADKTQRGISKKISDLKNEMHELKKKNVEWRRKLADIPALERQVKAALAKNHLSKSKQGKAIIENIVSNFEDTIKLIGM